MTLPDPITRLELYWKAILDKIQGGGSVTVVELDVSANDTYTAPEGKAYSPVVVDVPNTYVDGDEGRVVVNGELVAQTEDYEITADDTYDTTTIKSVIVNVGGPAVEVVVKSGTLADPFGGLYASQIATAIRGKNATVYLTLDASALGISAPLQLIGNPYKRSTLSFYAVDGVSASSTNCTEVAYSTSDNSLTEAAGLMAGNYMDVSAYAALVPSTLTYVSHPLPTE